MFESNEKYRQTFKSLGRELDLKISFDTHYDAQNFEFSRIIGLKKTRIDFQPMDEERYVVTKLTDTYRIYPQIVDILYACVPLFPAHRFVNVELSNMGEIPTSLDLEEFTNTAKRMLVDAL